MNRRFTDPKVIDNDAIVVLCLASSTDKMTHHDFKLRAAKLGFELARSDCHNMLHRATGRVVTDGKVWSLTTAGKVYRDHVVSSIRHIAAITTYAT